MGFQIISAKIELMIKIIDFTINEEQIDMREDICGIMMSLQKHPILILVNEVINTLLTPHSSIQYKITNTLLHLLVSHRLHTLHRCN